MRLGLKRSKQDQSSRLRKTYLAGSILVSLGALFAASGGTWDVTNHLLNKPETFFSPQHAVLYFGVGSAVFGSVAMFFGFNGSAFPALRMPASLAVIGVSMMLAAGPFDYAWHLTFGLDGLLSPTHITLVLGMMLSSIGAFLGIIQYAKTASKQHVMNQSLKRALIVIGILSAWLTTTGLFSSVTLPFSNTAFFNFNPDPTFAIIFTTLGFPFLTSFILFLSFALERRFGLLTIVGIGLLTIYTFTSIVPYETMLLTIPFYILNIIPIVAADVILSFSKRGIAFLLAGAILGASFFTMYYPMITHTYNMVAIMPSLIHTTYFEMIGGTYPLVIGPSIAMGIVGVLVGRWLMSVKDRYLTIQ